jgi:hypothetical protein
MIAEPHGKAPLNRRHGGLKGGKPRLIARQNQEAAQID